jgi:hypothetical protein
VLRARLLAEAAAGFPSRPDDFGGALAEDRDRAGRFPGWPVTLIRDLGRAGEGTEAVMLSEALARVDPARRAIFDAQAALALAEAGLADDARAKIAEHVERWPADVQTRKLAGDALALLATPKRHSPSTRPPCRWPSRPTTGQPVSCPGRSSGSPPAALSRMGTPPAAQAEQIAAEGEALTEGPVVPRFTDQVRRYNSCSCHRPARGTTRAPDIRPRYLQSCWNV